MKIALVHDELMRRGGAEQVVRCFHNAFPSAPIYTMAYRPNLTYPEFQNCKIQTSWFNKICYNEKILRKFFFPLGLLAMKNMEVKNDWHIVLVSSTYCGKYIKFPSNAIVITYCHTPFRLAWYPDSYSQYTQSRGILKTLFNIVINILRKVDFQSAQRTDFFIANTAEVGQRIVNKYKYKKSIKVIRPPVNCKRFYVSKEIKDYYLVVSRLESYKKIDLVVETFNELNLPLIIVGKGSMEEKLKRQANPNIKFLKDLNSKELAKLYAECKAFIFPQKEDYGITPLEANASGRPVIAFGEGGVQETMIPFSGNSLNATALFFHKQTKECLISVLQEFDSLSFSPEFIRKHAEKFDEAKFVERIKSFVEEKYVEKFGQIKKHQDIFEFEIKA